MSMERHMDVYSTFIRNSPNLEATKASSTGDGWTVGHPDDGCYLALKRDPPSGQENT